MGKPNKEPEFSRVDVNKVLQTMAAVINVTIPDKSEHKGYLNSLLSIVHAHINPVHFRKLPAEVQEGLKKLQEAINTSYDKSKQDVLDAVLEEKRVADKAAGKLN